MSFIDSRGDTDRDLAMVGLACAGCAAVLSAMAVLVTGASVGTVLLSGVAQFPAVSSWGVRVWDILTHPADPGTGLPPPWSALTGHPLMYWSLTGLLAVFAAAVLGTASVLGWRRFGPTPAGHASRAELRAELSIEAARKLAVRTRPGLSAAQRRVAAPGEVGAPYHRGPAGPLCVPFENPTGTLAPTQSGKSRRDLAHKALDAPGALLCSTTKPDLFEFTALSRYRRGCPVALFDVTGSIADVVGVVRLRWSPIQGCDSPAVAARRATTMVEASAVGLRDVGGNDKVFRDRAAIVLGAYLLAAAIGQKDVVSLLTWTLDRTDDEPATILDDQYPERANNLRQEANMVAETSDAVWMSVRRVVEPLLDDDLRELCSPPPGEGFDAHRFIAAGGSLFLVAGAQEAGPATPLLTALAEYWIETARQMAFSYPTRRLDPPATAVLDEVAGATPIPNLPATVADSAGRGVIIHWAAQSRAQLDEAFGINMAKVLIDTTTLISLWGGLKDDRTLEWASTLCGHYERRRYQSHSEGTFAPGRATLGTETVPVLRPGEIRMIPRREVVIVYRTLGPIRARTQDVSDRPDWPAIRADIDTIRQGGIRTADADSDRARSYPVHPLPAPTFDPGYGSGRGAGSGWQ